MSGDGYIDNTAWDEALESNPDVVRVAGVPSPEGRPTTEVLHRPGELIVDRDVYAARRADHRGARELLDRSGARLVEEGDRAASAERLGLRLLEVDRDADLVGIVREGRRFAPQGIGLVTVLTACPQRHGGCAPPQPVATSVDIPGSDDAGAGITVGVLDTGIFESAPFPFEAGSEDIEPVAEDPPGTFGPGVGHGTMVAGVIARYAPGARLVIRKVLDTPLGVADELEIAQAIADLPHDVDIVNASFGGFDADDTPLLALERELDRLPRDTLVVAAAGNEGLRRPEFMAAFKRVVGVASVEWRDLGFQLPEYTNRGYWVDCSAEGTDVESTFLAGSPSSGAPEFTGHARCSGTSFAAPKVTAAAATIAARYGIGVRLAAQLLIDDRARPVLTEGGTVVVP